MRVLQLWKSRGTCIGLASTPVICNTAAFSHCFCKLLKSFMASPPSADTTHRSEMRHQPYFSSICVCTCGQKASLHINIVLDAHLTVHTLSSLSLIYTGRDYARQTDAYPCTRQL